MSDRPPPGDIKRFLEVFDALDKFSAVQMHVRGYGALPPSEMPDPSCVMVRDWLKGLSE